jgi:DNA polymerase-3 subunit delta'
MFDAILGQEAAVGTLLRALASGRVHHAYRFEGPEGVGKELAALALAQALVCTAPPGPGDAHSIGCGACDACRRASTFSRDAPVVPLHPDVVIVERGLYPGDAIGKKGGEATEISIQQIRRVVLERIAFPPHEGRARVFVVRRPEELSTASANALLKTLEEPPARTHFVLVTSRPRELLDTIRSRTLPVRFGPLPERIVRAILEKRGVAADAARAAAELAGGSASAALDLADAEATAERDQFVAGAMAALDARDLAGAIAFAEGRERDRDVLAARLGALAAAFARIARDRIEADARGAALAARRHAVVLRTLRELDRNASPALSLETMVARLRAIA